MSEAINKINSSMGVSCTANKKCKYRHTGLCERCKNNKGPAKDSNCFVPKYN